MDLKEKRLDGEVLFEGRILRLERDRVELPNGQESMREVVRHPGAVAIVALKGEELLLVRQFRYAPGCELLEIPAGKLDPGESPRACAERELREETGYRGSLERLGTFYMTPGYTDEVIHIFYATDLVYDPLRQDEDEFLEVESIPWSRALTMAAQGEFNDGKTALGILLVQEKLK
ncbi:NUDIX domain-containing protein [Paradesulfitobacterium ferrireducens]|uniref:NUDIX domain-containing protein n=1 Tax=Paradesulfitobacterium ferrireducens TaxID=2816476 RepID=UPI001A8E143C|nr:NUDIX hydrolase [Paradesulfitobacterium ferrireducens]